MNRKDIYVPDGIRYFGDWKELETIIPIFGKFILNKSLPDCGATTWFLERKIPIILASPRISMLESKAKKHPEVFYYSVEVSSTNKLDQYIIESRLQRRAPKLMVTYDSLDKLLSALSPLDLPQYVVVIDEMQCLIGDAAFKGDSVMKVVNLVTMLPNVVYLSATVYEDSYLDNMDMFKELMYYRLIWPDSSTRPIQTLQKRMKSIRTEARGIIEKFKTLGYFETKILNGQPVYAREAVFFLNSVNDIISVIKVNKLSPHDVNVLCSKKSEPILFRKTKCRRGEAPQEGEPHKRYTFVTKASFEGTDFNSTNAYTYIFCDPNVKNMALDLFIDVPQIMGRQRLECNPFKYEATIFFKTSLHYDSESEFLAQTQQKEDLTNRLLNIYNNQLTQEDKEALLNQYEAAHENVGFDDHYLTVIEDRFGRKELHVNNMVKVAEARAWDIQKNQYCNEIRVLSKLEESGINGVGIITTPNDEISKFINDFSTDNNFERKMKLYCDYRDSHPGHGAMIEALTHLPNDYHMYYNLLGSQKIRSMSYKEKRIKDEIGILQSGETLRNIIMSSFIVGERYQRKAIKTTLQKIYGDLGISKKAKATDLEIYYNLKNVVDTCHGEKVSGYEIIAIK